MAVSLKKSFALAIFAVGIATGANAQQAASAPYPAKTHPCMSEHENVVAACKKGDPCSPACKQAHQTMKACRAANNLPTRPHTSGGAKKPGCKTGSTTPPANAPGGNMAPAAPTNP